MVNKVILIGNVGADPEDRESEKGVCVRLSLATNEVYKNAKGEKKENTEWHKLMVFGSKAEYVKKVIRKGMRIYIEGKLHTPSWLNGDKWQSVTYINVTDIQIMSHQNSAGEATGKEDKSVSQIV